MYASKGRLILAYVLPRNQTISARCYSALSRSGPSSPRGTKSAAESRWEGGTKLVMDPPR